MIAQRLSADIGWVVAGSPQYLDRFGIPKHRNDLQHHRCLRFRLGDERVYRWEFDCNGEQITIDVPGSITLDDSRSIVALLLGVGLMYGPEPLLAPPVKAGAVRLVLEDWTSPGPGFHIYYSSHRQVPVGLRCSSTSSGNSNRSDFEQSSPATSAVTLSSLNTVTSGNENNSCIEIADFNAARSLMSNVHRRVKRVPLVTPHRVLYLSSTCRGTPSASG